MGMIADSTDLAYLAGLIDGEGSITLQRNAYEGRHIPKYIPRLAISMTNNEPVEFMARFSKGYYTSKSETITGKPIYWFSVCNKEAYRILSLILPFLKCKHRQARLIIAFSRLPKALGKLSHEQRQGIISERDSYVSLLKRLNRYSYSIKLE